MKGHKPEVKESIRWAEQTAEGVVAMMHNLKFYYDDYIFSNMYRDALPP